MRIWDILILFCLHQHVWAGGSVIGNGGDPLFSFLETTRFAYVETLKLRETRNEKDYCFNLKELSSDQKDFCLQVFTESFTQFLMLNLDTSKIKFILKEEQLLVYGPDGKPMPVAARTIMDKKSPIEFHRNSINYYSPYQTFLLMAHEFGHKIIFKGKFIDDDTAIGPFASGRELLDAMAKSLALIAKKNGKIGSNFGLRDFFNCTTKFDNGYQTKTTTSSARMFFSDDFKKYQSGLGRNGSDSNISVIESNESQLIFKFLIEENNNCAVSLAHSKTTVEIIRIYEKHGNQTPRPDEQVELLELSQNPICEKEPSPLLLSTRGVTFSCLYIGSQGSNQENNFHRVNNSSDYIR
jgi:hypothetical protein